MLRLLQAVLFCAVLLGSGCSTSASRTGAPLEAGDDLVAARDDAASAPAATVDDDPLVCERVIQTGTRVAQRICKRRSEIEKESRDAQQMLGEVQKRGVLNNETKQ